MPTDYLEPELTAMGEFQWELGGLRYGDITAPDPDLGLCPTVTGDEGLDDVSELLAEDTPLNGDGSVAAFGRLAPRAITLRVGYAGTDEGLAAALAALRMVISPLPNRRATRWLRWQRVGEPAKRIAVQPAVGKPLTVPGDEARLKYGTAKEIVIRLTAPDPVILSDVRHDEEFTAGETVTCVNAGTFTALHPCGWEATFPGACTIENLDHGEGVSFSAGATVSRDRSLTAGVASRPNGRLLPLWPLLRPGDNDIRVSGGSATFSWRDTW